MQQYPVSIGEGSLTMNIPEGIPFLSFSGQDKKTNEILGQYDKWWQNAASTTTTTTTTTTGSGGALSSGGISVQGKAISGAAKSDDPDAMASAVANAMPEYKPSTFVKESTESDLYP